MIAKAFIATVAPYAVNQNLEGSTIYPSIRIAQSILETGCVIHPWNNLGGYKVGKGKPNAFWHGAIVNEDTWEVENGVRVNINAAFRSYDTVGDYYGDQDLLFLNTRYKRVREAKTPQKQAEMLYACGYATDPKYVFKIMNIVNLYGLLKYDQEVAEMKEQLASLTKQVESLTQDVNDLKVKTKVLDITGPPKWFTDEFGAHALDGIIKDPTGDTDFWRNTAAHLRDKK